MDLSKKHLFLIDWWASKSVPVHGIILVDDTLFGMCWVTRVDSVVRLSTRGNTCNTGAGLLVAVLAVVAELLAGLALTWVTKTSVDVC